MNIGGRRQNVAGNRIGTAAFGFRFAAGGRAFCYSEGMAEIQCYRCGASLAALTLPIARLDECPDCSVHVHCCRMCVYFDPQVAEQCREDDAEEVKEKMRANFCDYFRPNPDAFDGDLLTAEQQAKTQLDSLVWR